MRDIIYTAIALLLFSHPVLAQFQFVAPQPGSFFHNPERNIIIREGSAINPSSIHKTNLFTIYGSKSGDHSFNPILSDDGKTVILKTDQPFYEGEKITVTIGEGLEKLNGEMIGAFKFSFYTRPPLSENGKQHFAEVKKMLWEREAGKEEGHFPVIRNGAGFPEFTIDVNDNPAPGELIYSNFNTGWVDPMYNCIMTNNGDSLFASSSLVTGMNLDLNHNGYLTAYNADSSYYEMWDSSYHLVDTYRAGNGYVADNHEFQIFPDGHCFILCMDPQIIDMTVYDTSNNASATVIGTVLQELDASKNVVFEWRSWDHVEITEAQHISFGTSIIDYVHANAIELDHDGNLMMSCRILDQVLKISRETGEVMWRMGGQKNEFSFIDDTGDDIGFNRQHDIRRLPNGNITLFDNGAWHPFARSYAKEYALDEVNKTATLVWSYTPPPVNGVPVISWAMGNAQRLPNGNTLINWATLYEGTDITEVDVDGNIVWSCNFNNNDSTSYAAYRVHKYEWKPCARTTAGLMHTSDITVSSALLHWSYATNATYYKLYYRPGSGSRWKEVYIHGNETSYPLSKLTPSTIYDWKIQSVCDSLNETSNFSEVQTFTTLADSVNQLDHNASIPPVFLYPNPVHDLLHIHLSIKEPAHVTLELMNVTGQAVIKRESIVAEREAVLDLSLANLPAGMYLLVLTYGSKQGMYKVVLE